MLSEHIASQIYSNFAFEPTFAQKKIVEKMSSWLCGDNTDKIFILNGYAGTGKTSLTAAFVKTLKALKIKPVVMAPTGRAAKVAAAFTNDKTYTIHKKIYRQKSLNGMDTGFSLDFNKEHDACFIVDEASMISDTAADSGNLFGSGSLLDDLIKYVRNGKRCRLMLVGDDAQLPPVGHDSSPALNPRLMERYGDVEYATTDEVVRQQSDSGILFNATLVRCMLENGIYEPPLFDLSYPDFKKIEGNEILETVEECYSKYGKDQTIIITRSNKRASHFNQAVRRHVLYAEEELESGDMLMVVKNNYFYGDLKDENSMEFIANGDVAQLKRLRRFEDLYGFRFAKATLEFPDYDSKTLDCVIMLDTLSAEGPSLSRDDSWRLYNTVAEDYPEIKSKGKLYKKILENPYFNALQVKFSYAVTCHKAQGGGWSAVFVDRMLFGDEPMSRDLMRWLYTALTRATERVYLVNFDERFFDETN